MTKSASKEKPDMNTTNPRIFSITAAVATIAALIYAALTYLPNIDVPLLITGAFISALSGWVIYASLSQTDAREWLFGASLITALFTVGWLIGYYDQNTMFFVVVKLLVIIANVTALNAHFMFPAFAWQHAIIARPDNFRRHPSYTGPISI